MGSGPKGRGFESLRARIMRTNHSAGGIVFKKEHDKLLFLLVRPKGKTYWLFPKGLTEEGEDEKQTALREVREETGVKAQIVEKLGTISYFYTFEGEKIFKTVTHFLMEYEGEDEVFDENKEIDEKKWVSIQEMSTFLKFRGEIELFEKAKKALKVT